MPAHTLRIALLHLAPIPGDITKNRRLVEKAVGAAARLGATWIITPELIVTGYTFADRIGTEWIVPQPDSWMTSMSRLAARLRVTLFLSCPEQDRKSRKFYNSLFVIATNGAVLGTHRKINTLRVGSEAWSTPGTQAVAIPVPPFTRVGMLICADAYSPEIARNLQAQGAQLLVYQPHGRRASWPERRMGTMHPRHRASAHRVQSDRTRPDARLSSSRECGGQGWATLLSLSSARSAIFAIEWDLQGQTLATTEYRTVYL